MNNHALSIVLPNYNHGHFLSTAIESVLSQTFSNFELIIVDDGSGDHSLDLIESYEKRDSRIRILKHMQNRGVQEACKSGLNMARGKYVHLFSASDCYLPGFLEKTMHLLFKNPDIGLCCTDSGLFLNNPFDFINCPVIKNAQSSLIFPVTSIQKLYKYARFYIHGLTAVVKRESFFKHGGYRNSLHFQSDWFLYNQIALFEGAIYIPETLVVFREPEYSKISSRSPHIRDEIFRSLIAILLQSENRELLRRMKKAALLGLLGKEKMFELLKHPRLWSLYVDLGEKYVYTRLCRFFHKALVSQTFLKRNSLST